MPYVLQSGYATVGDFVMAPGYSPFGQPPPTIVYAPPPPTIVSASPPPPTIVYAPPPPTIVGVKKPGILAKIKGALTGKPPAPTIVRAKPPAPIIVRAKPPAPVIVGAKKPSILTKIKTFVTKPAVPVGPAKPTYRPPVPVMVQAPCPPCAPPAPVVVPAVPVLPAQPLTSGPLPTALQYTGTVIGNSNINTIASQVIAATRPTPALATQRPRPVSRAPVSFAPATPPRGWSSAFMPGTGL